MRRAEDAPRARDAIVAYLRVNPSEGAAATNSERTICWFREFLTPGVDRGNPVA